MELSHTSAGMSCRIAITFQLNRTGVDEHPLQMPAGGRSKDQTPRGNAKGVLNDYF
jgi:hypothetical protein